jgi:hypothetical protein
MKRYLAILAVAIAAAFGPSSTAVATAPVATAPVATASCVNAQTPGGVKCLQAGEFCSHKPGYAAAYHRAGFTCKPNGRLGYY